MRKRYGMHIGRNVRLSYKAKLDKSIHPKGVHIGDNTWVLANATVLAHDYCRGTNGKGLRLDTYIGANCVIGINAIIMPGVKIGDHVVVGSGAIVTKDIPSHSIAVGNPAVVVKQGVKVSDVGQLI